jgi:RNA polymerase sigma-70 factor, ECF subfamily
MERRNLIARDTSPLTVASPPRAPHARVQAPAGLELRDDTELLTQIWRGDEAAIAALYDRYATVVYSVSLRVLHQANFAEEIVQELFLEIWRDTEHFLAVRGSLGAWLAILARHRSVDALRRRQPGKLTGDIVLPSPCDLASEHERTALGESARSVLATLPPDQKRVLGMVFFDGLSHSEIAEMTAETPAAVRLKLRETLLTLRRESAI